MKSPSFDIHSLPFVTKACKIFKIGNRNTESVSRGFKGLSFPNEIYQEICKPAKQQEHGFIWKNPLTRWQKNGKNAGENAGEVNSPRTSIRMYKHPWGKQNNTPSNNRQKKYDEDDDVVEGVFTIELIKPYNGYLGLVLVGGADTPLQSHYVNDILPNSSASKSGRVRIGDELLEVNGHKLSDRTHGAALTVFRSLPSVIKLVVSRKTDGNRSLLDSMGSNNDSSKKGDPNISSPKGRSRKRSIMEIANETSVVPNSVSSVIDVATRAVNPFVKPAKQVKRVSRCSSFVGGKTVDDEDDVMSTRSDSYESCKTDYEKRGINSTSEWCSQQLRTTLQDGHEVRSRERDSQRQTSTFSLRSLADSLPGTSNEEVLSMVQDSVPYLSPFLRHGSLRVNRSPDLQQSESDREIEKASIQPTMFLRRGSLRARGGLSLHRISCIENQVVRATWPVNTRRQRASLCWDTFMPPSECSLRKSSSVCFRPSSVYSNIVPSNQPQGKTPQAKNVPTRKLQRANSGKYIAKRILATEILKDNATGKWGFTIAGGVCSPYGDLPIHILEIQDPVLGGYGLLKKGDEIVEFNGDNFEDITFLEANRAMWRSYGGNSARIVVKRKYLHHDKSPVCSTYAGVWNAHAKGTKKPRGRPQSFYC